MKYIVMSVELETTKLELPFVFPDICVHADMAQWIARCLMRQFTAHVEPISAGFLSSMDLGEKCHGRSESLSLNSRGKIDDALISMCDYGSMHA